MLKVTKAVFPVAGLGTRFLPATKASPKEMLPVVDKPLIQYAVEEAIAAGITEMIFVTGRGKGAIEDHFDKSYEMEAEPLGLGHAVLCAEKLVGDNPFAVLLADDLLHDSEPVMKQLVDVFDHYHSSVIGVERIRREESSAYGVIEGREWEEDIFKLSGIVEKPLPAEAPSNLGVVGRYVLMPGIFEHLRSARPSIGGEIQLTDALASMLNQEQVLAYRYYGSRFNCGSKLGYVKATVQFALQHPEVREDFEAYLRECVSAMPVPAPGATPAPSEVTDAVPISESIAA